jgi:AcrR family transcriptional regulator
MSINKIDTRTRILEISVCMLEEQKGKGVRMSDIANQAGVSRQAVYLHFSSRTELLDATTKYMDEKLDLTSRLAPSRMSTSGPERLALYVEFWGNYIPEIYGVAKAMLMVQDTDEAAAAAWNDRMAAFREGCMAAIELLYAEGKLNNAWTIETAVDTLWTMLSVSSWENLVVKCAWSNKQYISRMQVLTKLTFVK